MPTNRYRFAIDDRPQIDVGAAAVGDPTDDYAPPAPQTRPPAPVNVTATTGLSQADRSATAYLDVVWNMYGGEVQYYEVEWSLNTFSNVAGGVRAASESVRLNGLKPGTNTWLRVRAVYREARSDWSAVYGPITTAIDTTPPSQATGVSATFNSAGDFVLSGTAPSEVNFARIEAIIKDSAAGTSYATLVATVQPGATFQIVWPASENVRIAGGDPTLTASVRSQSWAGYYSSGTNYSATKSVPTLTVSVDFTGPDAVYTLTPSTDVTRISFIADTSVTAREIGRVGRYVYTLDANRLDHSGTADPSLVYNFTAYDALGQASTAATGTATNAAPSAPSSVSLSGFVEVLAAAITYTRPADFASYTVRIIRNSSDLATITGETRDIPLYSKNGAGTYQVGVKAVDVFGQASAETLSGTATLDGVTLSEIRALWMYRDSLSTAAATLDGLKDDNRSTNVVTYASGTSWKWTEQYSAYTDRIQNIVIALTAAANGYVGISTDGTTYTWYSGPLTGTNSDTLTAVASESAAQTAAVALPTNGLLLLPGLKEARYIRLGHRNTGAGYSLREFYAPTIVIADNILADSIKTRHIAAGQVTADRIAAATITASQIAANTITASQIAAGTITATEIAAGAITAAKIAADAIDGKTITGATIQTGTSGNRAVMGSGGFTSYATAALGLLDRSAPVVAYKVLDGSGAAITEFSGFVLSSSGARYGYLYAPDILLLSVGGTQLSGDNFIRVATNRTLFSGASVQIEQGLNVGAFTGAAAGEVLAQKLSSVGGLNVGTATGAGTGEIKCSSDISTPGALTIGYGINVGTASGAVTGQMIASVNAQIGSTAAINNNVRVAAKGSTTGTGTYTFAGYDSAGVNTFNTRDDGAGYLKAASWTYGSDESLKVKSSIKDHKRGLEDIKKLRPRQWRYKGRTTESHGLIAQELETVMPELVDTLEDGTKGIRYTELIPTLINALSEMAERIEMLEAK